MTLKVLGHHSPYNRGFEVAIVITNEAGDITAVTDPFSIRHQPPDSAALITPTLAGPMAAEFLQSALETAWTLGLRPRNWRLETTEQVSAIKDHLNDMRRLVFGRPPVKSMTDILSEMEHDPT